MHCETANITVQNL